ncbi:hypothetical protein DSO57_1038752 [Entomophthora muscae]|uniref:Uncharacterized protein n=1 Tax=Entomophthora muscae TaxID=34485 RepID=A0ACC2SMW5_9FUNG|nr:hypothetical protein DSO57_1038752 [Entomophthora muscae]
MSVFNSAQSRGVLFEVDEACCWERKYALLRLQRNQALGLRMVAVNARIFGRLIRFLVVCRVLLDPVPQRIFRSVGGIDDEVLCRLLLIKETSFDCFPRVYHSWWGTEVGSQTWGYFGQLSEPLGN